MHTKLESIFNTLRPFGAIILTGVCPGILSVRQRLNFFSLASLSENCSILGTDGVHGVHGPVHFRLKWSLYVSLGWIYGPDSSPVTNFKGNITGQTILIPSQFHYHCLTILKVTSGGIGRPLPPSALALPPCALLLPLFLPHPP